MNRLIGNVLNDATLIATNSLLSTPTDCMPIPIGIQPAEVRQERTTFFLAYRNLMDLKHLLYRL